MQNNGRLVLISRGIRCASELHSAYSNSLSVRQTAGLDEVVVYRVTAGEECFFFFAGSSAESKSVWGALVRCDMDAASERL